MLKYGLSTYMWLQVNFPFIFNQYNAWFLNLQVKFFFFQLLTNLIFYGAGLIHTRIHV